MFEITISTHKSRQKDISFIINRIRSQMKLFKGIMVCEEIDNRVNLALAVKKDKKEMVLAVVFDAVAEAIVRGYKEEFLFERLQSKMRDKVALTTFVKALTMFDKSSDKDIIKKQIDLSDNILIDSLYKFRLWELENRWGEIANLVADNSSYLLMSGTFMELMRFLIMSNESEFGLVHLHSRGGDIFAESKDGKEVFSFKYKEKDDNSKIKVISELITLAPEKIILHNDIQDEDLSKFLVSLFDGKISVIK